MELNQTTSVKSNVISITPVSETVEPHHSSYPNPFADHHSARYSEFVIATVRSIKNKGLIGYVRWHGEELHAEEVGPVEFGVYGRKPNGLCDHICDKQTLKEAQDFLSKRGVVITKKAA